ncbi:hypothetical protein H5410_042346 [Solanum commersonii]|uniref:Uncharacterized protein n=1 Tax=Solanum commersonii TaxID=4109 RepID=A0A9J5XX95_SOLCO|nr:hypothetical protein H5410_042346 [Solanum commersonii]
MDHISRGGNARGATNIIDHNNARRQSMQEAMERRVDKCKERLQHLQNTVFQLANYYFVFQGVILASISQSSSLNCSNRWFLFTLTLFAAIINLYAIYSIGKKYIVTLTHYDIAWKEYNDLMFELSPRNRPSGQRVQNSYLSPSTLNFRSVFFQTPQLPGPRSPHQFVGHQMNYECQVELNQQWEDPYTKIKRRICLAICLVLLGAFAGIILHGCWSILCKNDDKCSLSQSTSNCIKLCDISKCMTICSEF